MELFTLRKKRNPVMASTIHKSHFYAFGTVFLWAFAYVFTRWLAGDMDPIALALLRCATAAAVFVVVLRVKKLGLPKLADYPLFFLSGALGLGLYLVIFNLGLQTITATTSCIIMATTPLLTAFFASAIFGEKLPPLAWAALGMAFCGILVLSLWNGVFTVDRGILWTLAAAFSLAAFNIVQRYCRTKNYTPLQITAYNFFTATIMLLAFAPTAVREFAQITWTQRGIVIFLGVFPSAIAYMWWAKALNIAASTSSVANYMFLTPFLALVLGLIVLREMPHAGALIGGAVILGGLGLFSFSTRTQGKKLSGNDFRQISSSGRMSNR